MYEQIKSTNKKQIENGHFVMCVGTFVVSNHLFLPQIGCPSFPFMRAVNLRFCTFSIFGANNLQIRKNDYASRLAEIKKHISLFGARDLQICKNDYVSRLADTKKTHIL